MNKFSLLSLGVLAMASVTSCEEDSSTGSSLVQDEVEIIMDSTFTVTGRPVSNDLVQSRTVLQLLGSLKAEGYGTLTSDVVCQYMPASVIDTFGVKAEYIDSVKLILTMYKDGFAGDSIAPMGLKVYELNRQLPSPIYSDFDPTGYYDSANPIASASYSGLIDGADHVAADESGNIYKDIMVTLPKEFGVRLFNRYKESPNTFSTPQAFAEWFRGFYIANSFGSGRVTRISSNMVNVYYRSVHKIADTTNPRDTTLYHVGSYLAVTPEVLTNNNISYTMSPDLKEMADNGETVIVGPTGYDVEFTFPAREILQRYNEDSGALAVINSLTFSVPVKDIENNYGLTPPPYILMVKKSDKDKFFAKSQVNDNLSSFYASYNSVTRSYSFSSMREYIIDLLKKGEVTDEDVEFVICPVLVSFLNTATGMYSYYSTQSTVVGAITPYVTEPVMAVLDLENAKVDFTFSKQTVGF